MSIGGEFFVDDVHMASSEKQDARQDEKHPISPRRRQKNPYSRRATRKWVPSIAVSTDGLLPRFFVDLFGGTVGWRGLCLHCFECSRSILFQPTFVSRRRSVFAVRDERTLHEFVERMIPPRIRDTLLNLSYFDVQHNARKELLCYADGYPIPDVRWIRGLSSRVRWHLPRLLFSRVSDGCHTSRTESVVCSAWIRSRDAWGAWIHLSSHEQTRHGESSDLCDHSKFDEREISLNKLSSRRSRYGHQALVELQRCAKSKCSFGLSSDFGGTCRSIESFHYLLSTLECSRWRRRRNRSYRRLPTDPRWFSIYFSSNNHRMNEREREIVVVFRSTIWFPLLSMSFDWKLFLVPHLLITRTECWSPPWTPFRTKSIKSLDTDGIERRWSFVGHRRNSAMDLVS